jgi:hypothetical protein
MGIAEESPCSIQYPGERQGTSGYQWPCTSKISHEAWRIIDLIKLWRVHTHIPDWDCIDLDLINRDSRSVLVSHDNFLGAGHTHLFV